MSNPESPDIKELIRKEARRQRRHSRLVRTLVIIFLVLCYLGLPLWTGYLMIGGIGPGLFSESPPYILPIILILVYGSFFVIPFLLCLPVVIPLAIKQQNVARIVVFRKFNNSNCKRALGRIIKSHLAYFGHVFTLSDSKFKIKWYVRIPVLMGQFGLFHFRQRNINREEQIKAFRNKLNDYTWLNINWLLSPSKVFPVKTSDEVWKQTAGTLLEKNDLIIFDVSYDSGSLEWEIMEARQLGYEKNIIAVASIHKKDEAIEWKNKYDLPDEHDIELFYYDDNGVLTDAAKFEDLVVEKLAHAKFKDARESRLTRSKGMKRAARISGVVLLAFTVILFFMSPYLLPDFTGMNTPFPRQAVRSLIQSKMNDPLDDKERQGRILGRIKRNWPKTGASLMIKFARHHHETECEAIQEILPVLVDPERFDDYIDLVLTGEPYISDVAFDIILSKYPEGNVDLAFRLLQSNRVYVREKGSRLLKLTGFNRSTTGQLIDVLFKLPAESIPEPFQHKASGLFSTPATRAQKLNDIAEQTDLKIGDRLFGLISPYISLDDTARFQQLAASNRSPGIRFLAARVLANFNDATGIAFLSNAAMIAEGNFEKTNSISFSLRTNYPYRKLCDTLLVKMSKPHNIPSLVQLHDVINKISPLFSNWNNRVSFGLYLFIMRHYPPQEFKPFLNGLYNTDAEELINVLNWRLEHDPASSKADIIEKVRLSKDLLIPFLGSEDIDLRLRAALLLAHIGESLVARVAVKSSDNYKGGFSWNGDYSNEAETILKVLKKYLKAPYDRAPFIDLNPKEGSDLDLLLKDLIRGSTRKVTPA